MRAIDGELENRRDEIEALLRIFTQKKGSDKGMIDDRHSDGERRVFAEVLRQATRDYEELVGEL